MKFKVISIFEDSRTGGYTEIEVKAWDNDETRLKHKFYELPNRKIVTEIFEEKYSKLIFKDTDEIKLGDIL